MLTRNDSDFILINVGMGIKTTLYICMLSEKGYSLLSAYNLIAFQLNCLNRTDMYLPLCLSNFGSFVNVDYILAEY